VGLGGYEKYFPSFSFKYFLTGTKYYTREDANSDKNSLFNFLDAMATFSNMTWGEIKRCKNFHAHSVSEFIPELQNLALPLFQFKLPNHGEGRFVGYFDEDSVFCVLIYDRNHKIYARK
jgi:hypothetical protein